MTSPSKKRPIRVPPRRCGICSAEFQPNSGAQKYCDEHKNGHTSKRDVDRRKLRSAERAADYYRPKTCAEDACDVVFIPRTGSARYCDEHQIGAWARQNPEKAREMSRRSQRRYRHRAEWGDAEIYGKLVAKYGERCGICDRVPDEGWHLAVDHCHDTGVIRGLLCARCNTGLGYFEHEAERLRAAAAFLERHAATT